MAKYRSDKIRNVLNQFKGKKRKFLQTRIENPESDNWSVSEMARQMGITRNTLYEYLQDEKMLDAILSCCKMLYAYKLPNVVRQTVKRAESSDKASDLIHRVVGLVQSGTNQSVNVAVHKDDTPTTLKIDTPEQLEQAIAQCQAEMTTLQELMGNLVAMRAGTGRIDPHTLHPGNDETTTDKP